MMKQWRQGFSAVLLSICFVLPAQGDSLFGDFKRLPYDIERGFSIGADFGLLFFTGTTGSATNPGFQIALSLGYDIFDYLSIEAITSVGINEASPLDPVLTGGVNTLLMNLALKGQFPLGRFYPFLEVGPGVHISSPDFVTGQNNKMTVLVAGGFEYYTYLRHYSLYMKASYLYIDLPIDALSVTAGIRYTF